MYAAHKMFNSDVELKKGATDRWVNQVYDIKYTIKKKVCFFPSFVLLACGYLTDFVSWWKKNLLNMMHWDK